MDVVIRPSRFRKRRIARRRRASSATFRPRHFLLTKNEAAFFRVLTAVLGNRYVVSCKVRLADIITCADPDWRRGHANRISQKHVDFVVSDPDSSRIVAVIELDDRSHRRLERRKRDAFVNDLFRQMQVRLIRIPARWDYDLKSLAARLAHGGLCACLEKEPGQVPEK